MSFQTNEMGIATLFKQRRHGTATTNTTNPWVDQCTVCSALKI